MTRRIERVNELIKEEIASLLARDLQDPRLSTMISVMSVATSPDLRNATVSVSVLGSNDEARQAMTALRRASGFLRRELGARLHLRHIPELTFRQDTSIEEGARVMALLREIEGGEGQ